MAFDQLLKGITPLRGGRVSLEDLGVYLLPQAVPPRNATLVDQSVEAVIAAGPGTSLILFQYQCPSQRRGILARLAVDAPDPAALPNLSFSVLRSGAPVPNYQLVPLPIGTVNQPDTVQVTFDDAQLLQVQVTNAAGFPFDVHCRVVAWFWDVIQVSGR